MSGPSGNSSRLTDARSCPRIKIQVDAACEGNPVVGTRGRATIGVTSNAELVLCFLFALPKGRH